MIPVPPMAAATEVAGLIGDLFIVLLAAKLGDGLFKRLGQPAIVGEILAGVVIGPAVLGLVAVGETIEVFAELGVVFLLFWVGLETKLSDVREVGRPAAFAGLLGIVVPFAGGLGLGFALGEAADTGCSSAPRWWPPAPGSRPRCWSRWASSTGPRAGRSSAPRSSTTSWR